MNQNTGNLNAVVNDTNFQHLLHMGSIGFFAPIMYTLLYTGIVQGLIDRYQDPTQLTEVANRTVAALWPTFLQTFQVGNIGGIAGVGANQNSRQVA